MDANSHFKVGDKVSFTISRKSGGGAWTFSSRVGVVKELNGDRACVAYRGRYYYCPLPEIRKRGEKSAVTEAFLKMGSEGH
jgi:hypothetical protein